MSIDNYSNLASAIGAARVGAQLDGLYRDAMTAWGAGWLADDELERLSGLVEARRALPVPDRAARRVRTGSRPASADHVARRRSWAASGWLPPQVAARFTQAEVAALAVIACEVARHGECSLCVDAIAQRAGTSRSTAKAAYREAAGLGFVTVTERRLTGWRNDTNVVRIVSPEWLAWLRLRSKGGGVKSSTGFEYRLEKEAFGKALGLAGAVQGEACGALDGGRAGRPQRKEPRC